MIADDLRAHREALLAAQRVTADQLARRTGRAVAIRDLLLALGYSAYVVPVGWFCIQEGAREHELGTAALIVAFASLFFILLWRSFARSYLELKRSKTYEGVLLRIDNGIAQFEGGNIVLPPEVRKHLEPGVRYRIHAPETEDVAVDVAIDDIDGRQSAYR